jgi:hypothetical protein
LTVQVLAQATEAAKTANFTMTLKASSPKFMCNSPNTTARSSRPCPATSISASGAIDFARNEIHDHFTWTTPGILDRTYDEVSVANRIYISDPGKHFPRLSGVSWCEATLPAAVTDKVAQSPYPDPRDVLVSLKPPASLERLGTETIRGVPTTHYRVLHVGSAPFEVWVDANDLLRRMRGAHGGNSTTTEMFDYGTRIDRVSAPKSAPSCFS